MHQISLEIFAKRLKRLRDERNLSTRALGEIVGTSGATISRYENGKRDPDLQIVNNLAKFFNVTIEYLCGEENDDLGIEHLNNLYSSLPEQSKKDAIRYLTFLVETEKEG